MMKMLVAQSYLTLSDPMDCSLPGSSVDGILQARILEWAAIPFSRGVFLDWVTEPKSPALQADSLPFKLLGKSKIIRDNEKWTVGKEKRSHERRTAVLMSGQQGPLQDSGAFSNLKMLTSQENTWEKREEPVSQAMLKENIWHIKRQ